MADASTVTGCDKETEVQWQTDFIDEILEKINYSKIADQDLPIESSIQVMDLAAGKLRLNVAELKLQVISDETGVSSQTDFTADDIVLEELIRVYLTDEFEAAGVTNQAVHCDKETETDFSAKNLSKMNLRVINCDKETGVHSQTDVTAKDALEKLQLHLRTDRYNRTTFSMDFLETDDIRTEFYTGLGFALLHDVFKRVQNLIKCSGHDLEPFKQLVLTLMKLRLNLEFEDLGYRFGITQSAALAYFSETLQILYEHLKSFIACSDPLASHGFKKAFRGKNVIILDCLEVTIEKPPDVLLRQSCWSNEKGDTTVKYLVNMTPQGFVSFISDCWTGNISDRRLVVNTKFINNIKRNDIVITGDDGFLIREIMPLWRSKSLTSLPALIMKRDGFEPTDITECQGALVKPHLKALVDGIKCKFKVLAGTIPLSMLAHNPSKRTPLDEIVTVCFALGNLCKRTVL